MLCFITPDQILDLQFDQHRDSSPPAEPAPSQEELRHLIIGSPNGVRSTIHQLHTLHYADPDQWSQLITIPPSGILITHQQGEVLSFLLRRRQLR